MSGKWKKTNGCGSNKATIFGIKIVPPLHIFFNASCNKHDELYNRGGKEIDRKIADLLFLHYMKEDSWAVDNAIQIPFYLLWSYIYYIGVRIGGRKSFNYN